MFPVVKVSRKTSVFSQIEEKKRKTPHLYNRSQSQDLFTTFVNILL